MNLREMKEPTYSGPAAVVPLTVCDVCKSLVPADDDSRAQHSAWHREIVEWLQSLRDGKADSII